MAHSAPLDIPRPKTSKGTGIPVDMVPIDGGLSAGGLVNPEPLAHEAMQDLMLEEYLSPRRLRELTGVDNLEEVEYLELRVDTSETTLGNFGILVPNLKHLKLTGSSIQSVRDLGSSLDNLQTLWMATTGLLDIDGLSSMCNLRELYLAFNDISDLSPCSMLDDLRILDLEGNQLDDITQVEFLSLCTKLVDLTLRGNPLCEKLSTEDYRAKVFSILPSLKNLDDKDVALAAEQSKLKGMPVSKQQPLSPTPPKTPPSTQPILTKEKSSDSTSLISNKKLADSNPASNPFTDDWNLINQFVREGTIGTESVLTDSGYSSLTSPAITAATLNASGRSATARPLSARPLTAAVSPFRPLSSMASTSSRLGSSGSSRPTTSRGGASSSSPTSSSLVMGDETAQAEMASSLLTKGPVLCGNPSRALRRRREFVTSATQSLSREGTSNRSSSMSSPNNEGNSPAPLVIDPENASSMANASNRSKERIGSVASLGERDVGSLLQDVDKWRAEFQISAVQRLKDKGAPDVLVVKQGAVSDDESEDELEINGSDDERDITSPVSPKPPSDQPSRRRNGSGSSGGTMTHSFNRETMPSQRSQLPPTILAPPLPLPAIGAPFRPITSSSSKAAASHQPMTPAAGSRLSSNKFQYVSAKPSQ